MKTLFSFPTDFELLVETQTTLEKYESLTFKACLLTFLKKFLIQDYGSEKNTFSCSESACMVTDVREFGCVALRCSLLRVVIEAQALLLI